MLQTLADDSEVVFDQPEESAGSMEPEGSVPNRRKEEWLETTAPYRGARPRMMEFDRPVDGGLGATSGGIEDEDKLRDDVFLGLRPEQQIQQEEVVQTPLRTEPRRNEGHQPRGPRAMTDESVLGTGDLVGQRKVTRGGIGRCRVSYAARSRGVTDGKPFFEDAEGTRARAPGTTGGTHDDKGTLV